VCAYQSGVCVSERCVRIRAVCAYQSGVCVSERCVRIRAVCAYHLKPFTPIYIFLLNI